MYYIVAEDGEIYKTSDRAEALNASDDGISVVIDAALGVALIDREAVIIVEWVPLEDEGKIKGIGDDEGEDGDE